MTINESQEQSLSHIELSLKKPISILGLLYIVVFIVTNLKGHKIIICDVDSNQENSTTNVVFKKSLNNL